MWSPLVEEETPSVPFDLQVLAFVDLLISAASVHPPFEPSFSQCFVVFLSGLPSVFLTL